MTTRKVAALVLTATLTAGSTGTAVAADIDDEIPVVITPTRLKQAIDLVPASVSILTAQDLERFGVDSIPEAMRFIPGMLVTRVSGGRYEITYHGTSLINARRMNVLVDGVSVYRPALSEIYWEQLPIGIEDVARIEVTRGPNSAAYGPNSMMAVVNIITKHPLDVERFSATLGRQDQQRSTAHVRGAFSVNETTSGYVSVSGSRDDGYDWISQRAEGHDTAKVRRLFGRTVSTLDADSLLELQASITDGSVEEPFASEYENLPTKQLDDAYFASTFTRQISSDAEVRLRASHTAFKRKEEWSGCYPRVVYLPELFDLWRSNPGYANALLQGRVPSGGTATDNLLAARALAAFRALGPSALVPLCGSTDQNLEEKRTDLELQSTLALSPNVRAVFGAGARHQQATSQTFFGGKVSNSLFRVFGNVEARPFQAISLNVGAYAERDNKGGWTTAPRFAVNGRLTENQSLRASIARGHRTPDLVEEQGDFSYTVRTDERAPDGTLTPRFYRSATSEGGLKPERNTAVELGYFLNLSSQGLFFEAKVFKERLDRLVSGNLHVDDLAPSNVNALTLRGAELQLTLQPVRGISAFARASRLLNGSPTARGEQTQYSANSGSLGISTELPDGWRAYATFSGASGDGLGESGFNRFEAGVSTAFRLSGARCSVRVSIANRDDETTYLLRETRVTPEVSRYDDRVVLSAKAAVAF